jgi:uncharacterized protein YndB with AHSA1/START domain
LEKNNVHTLIEKNKVIFKKFFDSPIELVFEVWTSHEHLANWWGPDGFTITTDSLDFSNGGIWSFIMHGPDGKDYLNKIQFIEIKEPHLIVYRQWGEKETADIQFETKIIFREAQEGTYLEIHSKFPTEEMLQKVAREYGAIEGGEQHLIRLGQFLDIKKKEKENE